MWLDNFPGGKGGRHNPSTEEDFMSRLDPSDQLMVAQAFSPSPQEAEAGRSLNWRPSWFPG